MGEYCWSAKHMRGTVLGGARGGIPGLVSEARRGCDEVHVFSGRRARSCGIDEL